MRAYRLLAWDYFGKRPRSLAHNYSWEPGWNRIKQDSPEYPYGLYSLKTPWACLVYDDTYCVVEVELAGDIRVHRNGYRSEYAKVTKVLSFYADVFDKEIAEYMHVPRVKYWTGHLYHILRPIINLWLPRL